MIVRALITAIVAGLAAQVAMVVAGHHVHAMQDWFGPGGILLSLAAGFIYARMAGGSWGDAMLGGTIAGGVCALVGIGVSHMLGDVPASLILLGTAGSAVAGLGGGAIGRATRGAET
jgi:hypothetical protein